MACGSSNIPRVGGGRTGAMIHDFFPAAHLFRIIIVCFVRVCSRVCTILLSDGSSVETDFPHTPLMVDFRELV
jgi:hypothetical protein